MMGNEWKHGYSREKAGLPAAFLEERKFWPSVNRIDDVYGDRALEFSRHVPKEATGLKADEGLTGVA
jgi:glycine dehydrogenase